MDAVKKAGIIERRHSVVLSSPLIRPGLGIFTLRPGTFTPGHRTFTLQPETLLP
jgi:hypothetical protein